MSELPVETIVVTNRHRTDMGDIAALAESIRAVGLLHPVVVTTDGRLVAGARRLLACRQLGWMQVPVTVATNVTDASLALTAERDENTCRKEMIWSERLALETDLKDLLPTPTERRSEAGRHHGRGQIGEEKITPPIGKTDGAIAKALGTNRITLGKAKEVHEIATAPETPEPVRKVAQQAVAEMDRTGKVEPNYQAVKAAESAHAVSDFLGDDPDINRLKMQKTIFQLVTQLRRGLLALDVDSAAAACDEDCWDSLARVSDDSAAWFAKIFTHRKSGLRVVGGSK